MVQKTDEIFFSQIKNKNCFNQINIKIKNDIFNENFLSKKWIKKWAKIFLVL